MTLFGLAVAGGLAPCLAVLTIPRPRWALFFLVAAVASNSSVVLGSRGGLSPYLATLGLASLSLAWGVARGTIRVTVPPAVVLFGIAIAVTVPSVAFARDGQISWSFLVDLLKDLWFLTVVVLLARSCASAWTIARTTTLVLAAISVLTLVDQFLLGNRTTFGGFVVVSDALGVGAVDKRHAGPFVDPNFFGRVLLLTAALGFALAVKASVDGKRWARAGWSVAVLAIVATLFLSGSRGAMMGLVVAMGVTVWFSSPGIRRRSLLVAPVVVLAMALLPGVGSRLASLVDLESRQSFVEPDLSLVERAAIQKVVLSIFLANPTLGVGPDNTSVVWSDYSLNGGSGISRTAAPHNLYLQLAAETGIIGFVGWMVFLLGTIVLGARIVVATPASRRGPPVPDRVLAAAAVGAVSGWCFASLFLHLNHLKLLLLVVAVIACIPAPIRDWDEEPHLAPWVRPRPVLVGLATVLVLALGLTAVIATRPPTYVARVQVALVATSAPGAEPDAYAQSVTGRRLVVATYAAVVNRGAAEVVRRHPDVQVSVLGSGTQALLTIRVEGQDRAEVERAAAQVSDRGDQLVRDTPPLRALAVTQIGVTNVDEPGFWRSLTDS